ncbi:hypothetical protein [Pseudobacteriovorax antillogorgiicola]|uniref:Lipoprotein n=1 Tax=Pseudobacteriovorax antillogorgiicola TaxID=1513793 RepID=A0A1Y6BFJ3_9BACT|nr:hypothetical protein [Pseudobacteriovorax antillogorgiicola]TCS56208.1 hypothetical protein EDD56_10430 [Pseudobacteriovorax antillogorgiicola]SMF08548.1 hypothetical protein SAMN06296036_104304 [Pseudobacteriovorax antillogorgiicola]
MQLKKLFGVWFAMFLCACGNEVLVTEGPTQQQVTGRAQGLSTTSEPDLADDEEPEKIQPIPALTMAYNLSVTFMDDVLNRLGTEIPTCSGSLDVMFLDNFEPSTNLSLNCLGIDLSGLINSETALNGIDGLGIGLKDVLYVDGLIRISKFMGASYDPPRPVFIKPFFPDEEFYTGFSELRSLTLKTPQGESAQGSYEFSVLNLSAAKTVEGLGELRKVRHVSCNARGFSGISPFDGFNFKLMEVMFHEDPVAIPRLDLGFATADAIGFAFPLLPAEVLITLDLVRQDFLAPFAVSSDLVAAEE